MVSFRVFRALSGSTWCPVLFLTFSLPVHSVFRLQTSQVLTLGLSCHSGSRPASLVALTKPAGRLIHNSKIGLFSPSSSSGLCGRSPDRRSRRCGLDGDKLVAVFVILNRGDGIAVRVKPVVLFLDGFRGGAGAWSARSVQTACIFTATATHRGYTAAAPNELPELLPDVYSCGSAQSVGGRSSYHHPPVSG